MTNTGGGRQPKYQRIADTFREAIEAGEYGPGDRLPGENDIVVTYGVARMTARQAMRVLQSEGIAESRKGAGVFVRARHPQGARHPQVRPKSLHSVSVAGVVVREDGRVLAICRADNGTWEPPGGVLELDETPDEGICREVHEETGIRVRVDRLTGVYKNMTQGVVAMVFRCHAESGHEQLSDESTVVEWLTTDEVTERMSNVYAVRVLDAFREDGPHVRSHDGRRFFA